jgi:hypothetical protein
MKKFVCCLFLFTLSSCVVDQNQKCDCANDAGFVHNNHTVEGTLGGREIFLSGTVFAWWDTTVYDLDVDGNIFLQTRDGQNESLHIAMYGFPFKPTDDIRFLPVSQQLDFASNVQIHDSLQIKVGGSATLANSNQLEYDTDSPPIPGSGPYLAQAPNLKFGASKINPENGYPTIVKNIGSHRIHRVNFLNVNRASGSTIDGNYELTIERAPSDRGSVEIGTLTISFSAKIIGERIGECNFDQGGAGLFIDPCDDLEIDGENP